MIEKKYLKTKPLCKVKFALPSATVAPAKSVSVVGDFNDWDLQANPMKRQKSGLFASTVNLKTNNQYQFRYVLDGHIWLNDEDADGFVASNISMEKNGVLAL